MRKSLCIGKLQLNSPFVLAPLAGITDKAMRSLCAEQGASLTYTEMVSGKGLWYGDRKTGKLLEIGEQEGPVGYQLFGSEPVVLANAVDMLLERPGAGSAGPPNAKAAELAKIPGPPPKPWPGYTNDRRPVLFDLNSGCPVPKIVRNGEGSALLKNLDLLHDCVRAMVDAASAAYNIGQPVASFASDDAGEATDKHEVIPVTAKIRIGFVRGENIAVEAAKAIEAAGAAAITVHGRTREQFYEGKADWSAIAAVKKAVNIPVIGNGDVMTGEDAIRMMDETGCDGVMIARGALGNPWIFRDANALWSGEMRAEDVLVSAPTREERIDMLLRQLDLVAEDKGDIIAVKEMRKHIGWYVKGLPGASAMKREANTISDIEQLRELLRNYR